MMNIGMVNLKEGHASQEWHQSPDGTYGKQSGENAIKWDLRHSANPLSYGQSRNSATSHYAQVSDELNRSHALLSDIHLQLEHLIDIPQKVQ